MCYPKSAKSKAATRRLNFLAWFNAINLNDCYLSVITLLEIEQGILRVRHRGDEAQFMRLQQWLNDTVIPTFDQRILPIDRHTARICVRLHVPDQRPYNDALIAATAIPPRPHAGNAQCTRFCRTECAASQPVFGQGIENLHSLFA